MKMSIIITVHLKEWGLCFESEYLEQAPSVYGLKNLDRPPFKTLIDNLFYSYNVPSKILNFCFTFYIKFLVGNVFCHR